MSHTSPVYVGYIGIKSVTLCGVGCNSYRTETSENRRGCIVNRFGSEAELNGFLQRCISEGIPFAADLKSNAYQEVCDLITSGCLQGVGRSMTWDMKGIPQISC